MEEWKPIPGMEGFAEASSLGRIRSVERTISTKGGRTRRVPCKILALHRVRAGSAKNLYLTVNIVGQNGRSRSHVAASLVLSAFSCSRPEGMVVGYRNGDRNCIVPSNLFWRTRESVACENVPDPSQCEIEQMLKEIRRSWSEKEERSRQVGSPSGRWTVPQVSLSSLPVQVADMIDSINKDDKMDAKSEAFG